MVASRTVDLSFELLDDGIEVVDPVEQRRFAIHGRAVGDFEPGGDDAFPLPVDAVASFRADRLELREAVGVLVRDERGELVAEVQPFSEVDLEDGAYHVELNGPIKVVLGVHGAMTISASDREITLAFPERRRVDIGARSYHRRPAATITVPDEPAAVAAALSYLGSALKTTSPERAYPTLRGHPPAFERGADLRVPPALGRPDAGITIEVPAAYERLFAVAPLAYYLAADVTLGDRPRLVTSHGFVHPLDGGGVEPAVERTLQQLFFLDCVTRTEGLYPVSLHERTAIEPHVDLDFADLYELPLSRRVEAYLEVPFETLEPVLPTWNLIAHVPPTAEQLEVLPYVIDNLAFVRAPNARTLSTTDVRSTVLSTYADAKSSTRARSARSVDDDPAAERVVHLEATDSMEDAWFGPHAPLNATKSLPPAYRNRLERHEPEWPISVAVVCNDSEMAAESAIADAVYGSREALPFDVTRHENLAVSELAEALAADVDFLHYIGHTTAEGFDCDDGRLDAATLDHVGVGMFFLNSCQSYRQGVTLIEAGAVGGVVTLSEVNNEGAARIGRTMARLLERGFPLRAAIQLARLTSVVGGHYIVVGDGTADLVSPENGLPLACRVEVVDGGRYDVGLEVFLPREGGMGTMVFPLFPSNDLHYLAPGLVASDTVTRQELLDLLALQSVPVVFQGELVLEDYADHL